MKKKQVTSLVSGELVTLDPGQYVRLEHVVESSTPFVVFMHETNAVLVDFQGRTGEKDCWSVLAADEILVAWEDNLNRI